MICDILSHDFATNFSLKKRTGNYTRHVCNLVFYTTADKVERTPQLESFGTTRDELIFTHFELRSIVFIIHTVLKNTHRFVQPYFNEVFFRVTKIPE